MLAFDLSTMSSVTIKQILIHNKEEYEECIQAEKSIKIIKSSFTVLLL